MPFCHHVFSSEPLQISEANGSRAMENKKDKPNKWLSFNFLLNLKIHVVQADLLGAYCPWDIDLNSVLKGSPLFYRKMRT